MKRIIICALLVFLATGVVVGWLMLSDYWQRAGEEKLITDVICIFSEGNYRGTRYTFVFSDWEIFVQVKGSKDRKWYESKLEALPEPLMMRYPYWATTREGQILPPFPPHYPPFVRVCMPRDRTKPEKIIYFDSSDLEMLTCPRFMYQAL